MIPCCHLNRLPLLRPYVLRNFAANWPRTTLMLAEQPAPDLPRPRPRLAFPPRRGTLESWLPLARTLKDGIRPRTPGLLFVADRMTSRS